MIVLKSGKEIAAMRKSNRIVARILAELRPMIRPGIATRMLDAYADARAREFGSVPAFKGYRGFPSALCVSVNEEIVHGIPSSRVLREGDIVSLDFGILCDGFYGDAAVTVPVGRVEEADSRLIRAAEKAFYDGLEKVRTGRRLSDVSAAVQESVEREGFSVIRSFVGHGIGRSLHEEPQIPNFGVPGRGPRIKPGMTLAIEPMIAAGGWEAEVLDDGWTAVTRDGSRAAHFEHTVAVTEEGVEILSLDDGADAPRLVKVSDRERNSHA